MDKNFVEEPKELSKQNLAKTEERLSLEMGQKIFGWVESFIKELAERLEKMEEVLVVDRIEGNIAVCENRNTKKMQNINLENLPEDVHEGSILKYQNGTYVIDSSQTIEKQIEQKMKNVWKE